MTDLLEISLGKSDLLIFNFNFFISRFMFAHFNWDSSGYFKELVGSNKLSRSLGLIFCNVSGLQGFEDVISTMQDVPGFVALADSSDGLVSIDITPNAKRMKTVFIGIRHLENDMPARDKCLEKIREIFRQFLSHLLREKNRLHSQGIYLKPEITFHEIDRYFASGCACAYFQITVSTSVDLRFNIEEWTD